MSIAKVLVVGGGAAGMAGALSAARAGADVLLLEKNEKLGKKVYITGKGRCNVTNAGDADTFFRNIVSGPRFLYSAAKRFSSADVMALLEELGTPLKVERGDRVFPVSDHASDIIRAWEKGLREAGVTVRLNTEAAEILTEEGRACGVRLRDGRVLRGNAVIAATGGLSYPSTGSTGDGYRFAQAFGHTVEPLRPALVPLLTKEADLRQLEGLSLRNISFTVRRGGKRFWSGFGELLFTADGISGPLGLTVSSVAGKTLEEEELPAVIDLKPALTEEQLDARLLREFAAAPNRAFRNAVRPLYPASLCPVIVARSGVDGDRPVHDVTREERHRLGRLTKAFPVTLTGTRGFGEAVITQGGIRLKEIDPKTMESRLCRRLFFAGEVLDLDALTGGFNLQIAWTTGWCAGLAAAAGKEGEREGTE